MSEPTVQKPAVVILDMVKGYGWEPGSFGYEMVANVRKLKDAAYAAGVQVVHVCSMRRPTDNLPNASRLMPKTQALEVIPELQPVDKDIEIYKRFLSGFSHNDLDYTLRTMGVDCTIICGASTDNTVLWTSADAHQNRYKVVIPEDCTIVHRETAPQGRKEATLEIIRDVLHGEVIPLDEVISRYLQPK